MTNVLVISDLFPDDLTSGHHLRVNYLCRELAREFNCYFIALSEDRESVENDRIPPFIESRRMPAPGPGTRSVLRHLRLTNRSYTQRSWPSHFASTVKDLRQRVQEWDIDAVVNFSPLLGEYSLSLDRPAILDICDCHTLTIERALVNRGHEIPAVTRFRNRLQLFRQKHREKQMVRQHAAITTIGEPDKHRLLEISGVAEDRVAVVPNGVSSDAMTQFDHENTGSRSIVFWGNLDFPPNWTAVEGFYRDVFLPHLADKDIHWHIVGKGASDSIITLAKHQNIHLEGFVEDLYAFIREKGVMINPMIEGSGLKNKVIEAFAVGLPVVSTPLGVEAIDGEVNRHFLIASEPSVMAQEIEQLLSDDQARRAIRTEARQLAEDKYSWGPIGDAFNRILREVASQ
ncbi:MAG: glycosyltransferase family 4 protein [Woeseiaceae bacterium]|nr:glycosyltransferase family 4 protein [Woeseiaceae bacterium]